MAGDWIPFSVDLPHKLEVIQIAEATGRDRYAVVGMLLEFWAWADSQTEDGSLPGVSVASLSSLVTTSDATFWRSVCDAGWLVQETDGLRIPNFTEWMSCSAKKRLRGSRNKRKDRAAAARAAAALGLNVVAAGDTARTPVKTTGEDRRGENKPPPNPPPGGVVVVGFEALWSEYPKQQKREKAEGAFASLSPSPELLARILASLHRWKASEQWRREDGRFVPLLGNWIRARGWEDSPPDVPAPAAARRLPTAADLKEREARALQEQEAAFQAALLALPPELDPLRAAMAGCPDPGPKPMQARAALCRYAREQAERLCLAPTEDQVKTVAAEAARRRAGSAQPP